MIFCSFIKPLQSFSLPSTLQVTRNAVLWRSATYSSTGRSHLHQALPGNVLTGTNRIPASSWLLGTDVRPGLDNALSGRLATCGGLGGCKFLASLVLDGTVTDAGLISEAASNLAAIATDSSNSVTTVYAAAQILVQLSDPRGFDLLADLANGLRPADSGHSAIGYTAAQSLVRLSDDRGKGLLEGIVGNATFSPGTRHRSAEAVAELDRASGTSLLVQLASDPALTILWRRRSAESLLRLNDVRGADLLAGLAADQRLPFDGRVTAAERLAQVDDCRSHDLMIELLCEVITDDRNTAEPAKTAKARRAGERQGRGTVSVFTHIDRIVGYLSHASSYRASPAGR